MVSMLAAHGCSSTCLEPSQAAPYDVVSIQWLGRPMWHKAGAFALATALRFEERWQAAAMGILKCEKEGMG